MIDTMHQHIQWSKLCRMEMLLLCSNKSNEVLATPCPLKHLKKYVKREVEMPTTIMGTSVAKMTTAEMPKSMTTRMTPGMDTSMDTRKEHVPSKKRLHFEFDTTSNMTSSPDF